jgi:hypothetical protein
VDSSTDGVAVVGHQAQWPATPGSAKLRQRLLRRRDERDHLRVADDASSRQVVDAGDVAGQHDSPVGDRAADGLRLSHLTHPVADAEQPVPGRQRPQRNRDSEDARGKRQHPHALPDPLQQRRRREDDQRHRGRDQPAHGPDVVGRDVRAHEEEQGRGAQGHEHHEGRQPGPSHRQIRQQAQPGATEQHRRPAVVPRDPFHGQLVVAAGAVERQPLLGLATLDVAHVGVPAGEESRLPPRRAAEQEHDEHADCRR